MYVYYTYIHMYIYLYICVLITWIKLGREVLKIFMKIPALAASRRKGRYKMEHVHVSCEQQTLTVKNKE